METKLYVYFTDFTITCANLMGITYEDFNALIFCVIWPIFMTLLILIYFFQLIKWKRLKTKK